MSTVAPDMLSSPSEPKASLAPWWGAWSAFLIVACFYLIQTVSIFVVQFLVGLGIAYTNGLTDPSGGLPEHVQAWLLPLSLFVGTMTAVVVSVQVANSRAKSSVDVQWYRDFVWNPKMAAYLWRYGMIGLSLGLGFFLMTEYVVPPPEDLPQPLFDAMLTAPLLLQIGWVLMFVVLFPVVEECLFRGVLYTGMVQSWGSAVSFLLTTLAFVAVHMPKVLEYWPAAVAVVLIGSLTLWIRIRSQSLSPGIVLHSAYNGMLVLAGFFTASIPSNN